MKTFVDLSDKAADASPVPRLFRATERLTWYYFLLFRGPKQTHLGFHSYEFNLRVFSTPSVMFFPALAVQPSERVTRHYHLDLSRGTTSLSLSIDSETVVANRAHVTA